MTQVATKLQNRDEFVRWYRDGKTYQWIVDEYLRKYGISISRGTVSNWRFALVDDRRGVTSVDLVPWAVLPRHRNKHLVAMLRGEARRRQLGDEAIDPELLKKISSFVRRLREQDAVVHYDPDTPEGFWVVAARPGVDTDLVRKPEHSTRKRGMRS